MKKLSSRGQVPKPDVGEDYKLHEEMVTFSIDEGVRPDTNMEVLATLRPAFKTDGTVTAGNASQMSDGAAAVLVMEHEKGEKFRSPNR